jgi:hypothetical protein
MKKSDAGALLKQLIHEKETEHFIEGKLLREHFHRTYESLKPLNIIKNTFKEMISVPDLKTNVVNAAIGITTGFVVKKVFTGKSHNPLTKLFGIILEIVVASKVTKNADEIKSIGNIILKKIINQHNDSEKV